LPTSLPAGDAKWFSELGGRVVAIGTEVEDVDGTYTAWFADHGVTTVLQRPDFYVFGTAGDAADAAALLGSLRTMLGSGCEPTDRGRTR
jgi:hypothetical protein